MGVNHGKYLVEIYEAELHGYREDDEDVAKRRFLYRLWLNLGDRYPWADENEVMRWAFARFGNLGRSPSEWMRMCADRASLPSRV